MRTYVFGLFLISSMIFSIGASAQNSVGGVETKGMDMNAFPFGTIAEIGFVSPKTVGSHYMNTSWYVGDIYLKSGEVIDNYPLKFDLKNNYMEIKTDNGVKVLEGSRIKGFSWFDGTSTEEYINSSGRYKEGHSFEGFLQIVALGDTWSLYRLSSLKIVEGNYNPTLDIGNPDTKIVKKEELLLANKTHLFEIPKGRKKFASLFEGKEDVVLEYIKANGLDLKQEEDLEKVVNFVNEN